MHLDLRGKDVYLTFYEYLNRQVSGADFEIAGWRLSFLEVRSSGMPLAFVDASLFQVNFFHVAPDVWRIRPERKPRAPKLQDQFRLALEDLEDVDSPDDMEDEAVGDDGGGDDDIAGLGFSSSDDSEDEEEVCEESEPNASADGSDSGSFTGGARSSGSDLGDDVAGRLDDEFPPPMPPPVDVPMHVADPAPVDVAVAAAVDVVAAPGAPVDRGMGEEIGVPGGYLRYYKKGNMIVAHCIRHGDRDCRLTRTCNASTAKGRAGQGRPLGLMAAWLLAAHDADPDTADGHKSREFLKTIQTADSYQVRADARESLGAIEGIEEWFALERAQLESEEAEPKAVP